MRASSILKGKFDSLRRTDFMFVTFGIARWKGKSALMERSVVNVAKIHQVNFYSRILVFISFMS